MKTIFDEDFFARLERARYRFYKGRQNRSGSLITPSEFGEGVEFADYRDYASGEDPRHIDWNVYARLGRFFLKRFRKEESSAVWLMMDVSRSMDFGQPSKLDQAKRVAAGLGLIALAAGARVRSLALDGAYDSYYEGKSSLTAFLEQLAFAESSDSVFPERARLDSWLAEAKKQEIFLFTDFLYEEGPERMLEWLAKARSLDNTVHAVQLFAPEERDPQLEGQLLLRSVEGSGVVSVSANSELLTRYREQFQSFQDGLYLFGRKSGCDVQLVGSEEAFEEGIFRVLA